MNVSAPVWQLQSELVKYQSQLFEIEKQLKSKSDSTEELEALSKDILDIIAAYKEVLRARGVSEEALNAPAEAGHASEHKASKPAPSSKRQPKAAQTTITKKTKKSKGRKEEELRERVNSWKQFHSKYGAKRESIFRSPDEGSRTRVGFQGSPGTLTVIPERRKHEFLKSANAE
eukprot:jgi/Galph1/4225/GphlegSOOS_G2894.1